jgi:mRNA-degrading endonuclease toxin of MazEF toxin-antitoxin module
VALPWPRRGEIWSVWTPGQPEDPHQPRPALVVSENVRNRSTDDLTVIPIFSEGAPGPTRVALAAGNGGIRRDSVLFCEEITTIDRQYLARGPWDGLVDEDALAACIRAVRRALGEVLPE